MPEFERGLRRDWNVHQRQSTGFNADIWTRARPQPTLVLQKLVHLTSSKWLTLPFLKFTPEAVMAGGSKWPGQGGRYRLLHEVLALTSLFKDSTADVLTFLPVLVNTWFEKS
ncbi:MAG: hypothetical protein ABWY27_07290 [Telluria sp.]